MLYIKINFILSLSVFLFFYSFFFLLLAIPYVLLACLRYCFVPCWFLCLTAIPYSSSFCSLRNFSFFRYRRALFERTCSAYRHRLSAKKIVLSCRSDGEFPPAVLTDGVRLQSVSYLRSLFSSIGKKRREKERKGSKKKKKKR